MSKYRKKPVVIEAMQWTGENVQDIVKFIGELPYAVDEGIIHDPASHTLIIPTLEGAMEASQNDWIIKGVKGEFYPCKPDIFEETYESVENTKPSSEKVEE